MEEEIKNLKDRIKCLENSLYQEVCRIKLLQDHLIQELNNSESLETNLRKCTEKLSSKEVECIELQLQLGGNHQIGRYVSKEFEGGTFYGLVAKFSKPYFRVVYSDGDAEEYNDSELIMYLCDSDIVPDEVKFQCAQEAIKYNKSKDKNLNNLSIANIGGSPTTLNKSSISISSESTEDKISKKKNGKQIKSSMKTNIPMKEEKLSKKRKASSSSSSNCLPSSSPLPGDEGGEGGDKAIMASMQKKDESNQISNKPTKAAKMEKRVKSKDKEGKEGPETDIATTAYLNKLNGIVQDSNPTRNKSPHKITRLSSRSMEVNLTPVDANPASNSIDDMTKVADMEIGLTPNEGKGGGALIETIDLTLS